MNNIEHVFMITTGPCITCPARTDDGLPSVQPDVIAIRRHLREVIEHGDTEVFGMTTGLICTNVRNPDGAISIEPLLLKPIPMVVKIFDLQDESGNPYGVTMIGRVEEIVDYAVRLSATTLERYDPPIVRIGDMLRMSYHLGHCTGGFVQMRQDLPADPPPLVNSLSELCSRIAVLGESQRGRRIYQVYSTEYDRPVTKISS